jgi:hypothetical protein
MIAEIVFFDLPRGTKRTDALALYRQTAGAWAENPDLVEKYYIFDEARSIGGGVYIWLTREAALHWHGEDYRRKVTALYGSPPRIEMFDALMHVDPASGWIEEL